MIDERIRARKHPADVAFTINRSKLCMFVA